MQDKWFPILRPLEWAIFRPKKRGLVGPNIDYISMATAPSAAHILAMCWDTQNGNYFLWEWPSPLVGCLTWFACGGFANKKGKFIQIISPPKKALLNHSCCVNPFCSSVSLCNPLLSTHPFRSPNYFSQKPGSSVEFSLHKPLLSTTPFWSLRNHTRCMFWRPKSRDGVETLIYKLNLDTNLEVLHFEMHMTVTENSLIVALNLPPGLQTILLRSPPWAPVQLLALNSDSTFP